MIYDLLKKDHEGHIKGLRKLYDEDKAAGSSTGDSLFPLLERELAKKGMAKVRNDLASGVCSTLWLMRTFNFLLRFLENLANPAMAKDEAFDCARAAYKEVLYPYHRFAVSMVVKLALGACGREGRRGGGGGLVSRPLQGSCLLSSGAALVMGDIGSAVSASTSHIFSLLRNRRLPRGHAPQLPDAHHGGGHRVHLQDSVSSAAGRARAQCGSRVLLLPRAARTHVPHPTPTLQSRDGPHQGNACNLAGEQELRLP